MSQLTPLDVCKLFGVAAVAIAAVKRAVNLVFNPFFWIYFSWTWLFWPWFVAVAGGVYGIYCYRKYSRGKASEFEQLAIVTSAFTWLTLVPPAYFNGLLEGWPFVFFFVYHYFFFFNVSIRKRLYFDFYPRAHDPKWDVSVPNWYRALFLVGIVVGHWLAAFEGPELHLIPGGWSNVWIWSLIMVTLFLHYNASRYLSKYSEKVVVPTAVVQFGPYRWICASTMLLFFTYFVAL
uniref:Protein-S-isoprenylcysteine O-methyltransferase n=1 Tax=Opuntia streptacantha TaxID=393608 RepID=A0A7C9DUJ5_OPUST